jgi:hypothetical protein
MTTEANKALIRNVFEPINANNFEFLERHPGFWETRKVAPPMHAALFWIGGKEPYAAGFLDRLGPH